LSTKKLTAFVRVEEGQNIVEFALLLPVLMWILMGIIQFGFIFAIYITLNNAVREGSRWGSIYVYDGSLNDNQNDAARNDGIVDRIVQSRGIMAMAARGSATANFSTSSSGNLAAASCPEQTPAADTLGSRHMYYGASANPDVTVCYSIPTGVVQNSPRRGYYLDVQAFYHLQVFIPLIQQFLPDDPVKGAPWIRIPARITVVVN
jgi:Flp pilus assembly protein TadG